MGEPVVTEPQETLKTGTSSGRREATRRRSPEYERRETMADRHRDDWRESSRIYWRDRDTDRAPPRRVFDPQTGESHPLPYESKDRYIITHKASEPPTFRGYGITEYLDKWELHASRSKWSEEEIIENLLFNVDQTLGKEVKEARRKDEKWTTYKKNLVELYTLEDNKYSIKDLETMTQDEDESVRAFGMRFEKISDVLMKKGKISEVERCTIFIGHLSKGRQKSILRHLPRDKLDFPEVLKLAIKAEADDYKDLTGTGELARRMDELGGLMITHVALAMSLTGVEATLEAGGSRIRVGETDTGMKDMRDQTEMDIRTTDMRGRIETDTRVTNTKEEIDPMIRAGDTTEEIGAMIHAGDTTEEIDAMIHADDTTEEINAMIHADDTTDEIGSMIHAGDTTEEINAMIHSGDTNMGTTAMICAAGMREGDMARRLIRI
ncbi:hypothetical protein CBR_g39437 [Chara braunii]|uniref:Retrotransposon gag domain-containing protein n=1 Tax=Chara braunii TaxID=69332 RepID=A0A388LRM6_CHABU|nr:hypothetical protein CBR_g39437 [Chara braunii]|eukprot:GBG84974.1 hypothetical protein CBR_g39437 [Chara braunii]